MNGLTGIDPIFAWYALTVSCDVLVCSCIYRLGLPSFEGTQATRQTRTQQDRQTTSQIDMPSYNQIGTQALLSLMFKVESLSL